MPQDVELFSGTVAENIARFPDPDSDGEEMCIRDRHGGALLRQALTGTGVWRSLERTCE